MRSDPDPSLEPVPDDPRDDLADVPLYASAEDVAYAELLAALDREDDAALRAEWAAAGYDLSGSDDSDWDEALAELVSDDALVDRLQGPAHGADLMLLESIDPRGLRDPHTRVQYLQACDRVAARVASHRSAAVVALVGESSSEAYLPEIHLEHEVAVARRTSNSRPEIIMAVTFVRQDRAVETSADGPGRDCWLDPRLTIRLSPIEGRGLVATETIESGESVERLGGVLVTDDELRRMIDSATSYVDSVSVYDGVNLLLPTGSPAHFGNHSCDPTLWWEDPFTLVARIQVRAGSEVTVDYATLTDDPGFSMKCSCGAELCRGEVTGSDWQRRDLQQRYGDHWVPVLRRRIASG